MKPIKQMLDISSGPDFALNGQRSIMKTQIASPAAFSNLRRVASMTALANAVFLCGAVLSMTGAAIAQLPQKSVTQSSAPFQVGVHLSKAKPDSGEPDMGAIARETEDAIAGNIEQPVMTPTRGSFLAKWQPVKGATGYRLDVSTTRSFDSCVSTYRDLDVGNVTNHIVAGLNRGTRYYYRVRPYNSAGPGDNSETTSETTANLSSGLVIVPTFDSTITNDPRSSAIQAMIISAIQKYQTLFSDPITVSIRFRYSGYHLEGDPMGTLIGASNSGIHQLDWNPYITALKADGKTANDMSANATLPTSALSPIMLTNSANGRAVGLNTPPVMFADGSLGYGGPYDGIITINSLQPVQFTRPVSPGNFDGQMFTEHEIDEVLGSGSHLNTPAPQYFCPIDLFSWASLNARNVSASGQRFFSIDRGLHYIAQFNQNPDGDFGDYDSDDFCPATRLHVQNAFNCPGQSTDISATSPEGISLDVIGYDLAQPQTGPPRLVNISTRSFVQTSDNVMIGGFIVQGTGPKRVIIRAIGPELTQFGITNALADTTLELHNQAGAVIATNDDWQTTMIGGIIGSSQVSDIQNSGGAPTNDLESAIIATLPPGRYTAIVRGFDNTVGVGLVEVYDLSPAASSSLVNISTRSFVQTSDNVMIGGFIVQGTGPKRVIIRAIGPELTQFGITNALADTTLELHNSAGALIASNDDWRNTILGGIIRTDQVSDIESSGRAPTNDLESAIIATLPPGPYTAIVRGFGNTVGVALVEVYDSR
jgi:hypothetical protein